MNYVGVAETLGITGSAQAAGLAADNLLCAAYFATLFHLARHIPADEETASTGQNSCLLLVDTISLPFRVKEIVISTREDYAAFSAAWYRGPRAYMWREVCLGLMSQ